jgi:hypothetical protein
MREKCLVLGYDRKCGIQHSAKYTKTTPTRGYERAQVRQSDMVQVVIR